MTPPFLHKPLRRYIVAGLVANLAVLCLIVLLNYKNSLIAMSENLTRAPGNIARMKESIDAMDSVMAAIDEMYPYLQTLTSRDALLLTADTIKAASGGGRLIVKDIHTDGSEAVLPVEVALTTARYLDIVSLASHIQSLKIPYATMQELDIKQEDASLMHCTIKAALKMPIEDATEHQERDNAPPP